MSPHDIARRDAMLAVRLIVGRWVAQHVSTDDALVECGEALASARRTARP